MVTAGECRLLRWAAFLHSSFLQLHPPMAGMEARPWGPESQALILSTRSFLHRIPNHPAAFCPKHCRSLASAPLSPSDISFALRDRKSRQNQKSFLPTSLLGKGKSGLWDVFSDTSQFYIFHLHKGPDLLFVQKTC